jgi:hypothetical protein
MTSREKGVAIARMVGKRVLLALASLVVAPILGVWAGASMHNPAGNGPGGWQVVVGVGVPALLASAAAVVAGVGRAEVASWTIASLAATGGLLLLLVWFVQTHLA